jgi:transposase
VPRGPTPEKLPISRHVRRELKLLVRRRRTPHWLAVRARIVLLARDGQSTEGIAATVGWTPRAVRKWKARFRADPVVESLRDHLRPGRPPKIPVVLRCQLVRLACERPDPEVTRFRDVWTQATLAAALEQRTGIRISRSEVGRVLRNEEIRPHVVRQWLHCEDPEFLPKAKTVCDLYLSPPPAAVVLSIDEKPMQVLGRLHPTHVAADGSLRYEFEYVRRGTQVLLAAFDVRTGKVFGRVLPRRTAAALVQFLEAVARRYPTQQVYIVWDNLNIHSDGRDARWTRFNARHGGRFHFVHTPKHASWMNQVEIWFSILQRRIIRHADWKSADHQRFRVEGFIAHWNRHEAHPFRWTWRTTRAQNRRRKAA